MPLAANLSPFNHLLLFAQFSCNPFFSTQISFRSKTLPRHKKYWRINSRDETWRIFSFCFPKLLIFNNDR